MRSKGIQVKLEKAEKMRRLLSKGDLIRRDLKIRKDKGFIYIPIKKSSESLASYNIIESNFEKIEKKPKSYRDIIQIPDGIKQGLPTSYDIIGDIALIKLQENLLGYKKEIGDSLIKVNKNIKTVCLIKPVKGEFRTRNIEIIAGENRTKTIHKEYGLKFNIDISKAYFSPRLASERKRVADLVKPGEIIVDMFAGVAPFSIIIAKYAQPNIIYAFDKNKIAADCALKNIKMNNFLDKIEVINTDAKKVNEVFSKKRIKANRIIMNLPFSAHLFFKYALKIADDFCVIHYYDILTEDKIGVRIEELTRIAEYNKISLPKFNIKKIKTYTPREFYIGIDITAKRMPM
jgi:tRNA (guanine37-N1)-methyltransferase